MAQSFYRCQVCWEPSRCLIVLGVWARLVGWRQAMQCEDCVAWAAYLEGRA